MRRDQVLSNQIFSSKKMKLDNKFQLGLFKKFSTLPNY